MGFFSTQNKEEMVAVLDVSSGSVTGALFLKNKKELPFVLASVSRHIRVRDFVDAKRLQQEITDLIDQVCTELQKSTGARPSKIYCIMSTPWAHGELRNIHIKKEKEFQFTEIYAQKLISAEIEKVQKEIGENTLVVDRKIIGASLNGYEVKSPHGQKTREATLNIFLSFAHIALLKSIEDRIHKTFKSKILFTSQMLADFIFTRDSFDPRDSFILNVGEETTEIIFTKSSQMTGTAFFPYGKNNLVRNIAIKLGKTIPETESLFKLYIENSLDTKAEELVEKAIEFSVGMWQSSLKQVMVEVLPNRHLPHDIFLITGESHSSWLASKLRIAYFREFTTGHMDFSVIIPSIKTLHDFYDKSEYAKPNSNILIKIIYLNQI